ncbi:MAG: ATP-binding cassette domain-containing protein, partial [Gemmobacter sp.]
MAEDILRIEGLKVEATIHPPGERPRDVVLVHEATLALAPGRVLGLIGESGAGKSTIGLAALGYGRGGV